MLIASGNVGFGRRIDALKFGDVAVWGTRNAVSDTSRMDLVLMYVVLEGVGYL